MSEVIIALLLILIVVSAILILSKYLKNVILKIQDSSSEELAKFNCPSQLTLTYFGCINEDGSLYFKIKNLGDPIYSSSLIVLIGSKDSMSIVFAEPYPDKIEGIKEYNLTIPNNIGFLDKIKLLPSIKIKNNDNYILCNNLNEQYVKNC